MPHADARCTDDDVLCPFLTIPARSPNQSAAQPDSTKRKQIGTRKRTTVDAVWLVEDGAGGWDIFDSSMTKLVEAAWKEWVQPKANGGSSSNTASDASGGAAAAVVATVVRIQGPVFDYIVDVQTMTQTNATTHVARKILRLADEQGAMVNLRHTVVSAKDAAADKVRILCIILVYIQSVYCTIRLPTLGDTLVDCFCFVLMLAYAMTSHFFLRGIRAARAASSMQT